MNIDEIEGLQELKDYCKELFLSTCDEKCFPGIRVTEKDVRIIWSHKILQNFNALLFAYDNYSGNGVFAEYTYDGESNNLHEDLYIQRSSETYKCY